MTKILVVDDDADHCEALTVMLTHEGFEVQWALTGREALVKTLAEWPDIILLDLKMPGSSMDGIDLLNVLRSYDRLDRIPVVVLTGLPDGAAAMRAVKLGARKVLTKAECGPDDILNAVRDALA